MTCLILLGFALDIWATYLGCLSMDEGNPKV